VASADGLIFQLPPDGTWATFAGEFEAKFSAVGITPKGKVEMPEQKVTIKGTLTVSSVGAVERNELNCRWIELKTESKIEGGQKTDVLKMLIPEEYLVRGQDPLAHSVLTFFSPKEADKAGLLDEEGFNRIQYEIDRVRLSFPKPLENAKIVKGETVKTDAGVFENCEVITGTTSYDGPLAADGRMHLKGTYRIVVHPKAPFGVVALESQNEGRELSSTSIVSLAGTAKFKLTKTGKGAVSDLPDKGKAKAKQ
jgi:hypothetical protein